MPCLGQALEGPGGGGYRRTEPEEPPVNQAHEFHVEKVDRPEADAVVYRMRGVMGESQHCYAFLEEFLAALPAAPQRIIFHMGELENMFSSGIGIVANCYTQATDAGKRLLVVEVPDVIHRTLTITGIQPMLEQFETLDEALAS